MGPALKAMWEAAGGIDAWRRFEPAHFTYQASFGPAAFRAEAAQREESSADSDVRISPSAFRFPASRNVGPERISLGLRNWSTIGVGGGDHGWELTLGRAPDPDARDLALRGVRLLFCFPLSLGEPVWEFRRDLVPGFRADARGGFWAVPTFTGSPYDCCYVDLPAGSGVPRAVYYRVSHPAFAGRIFKAVFRRFETVQGIRIPTEIAHYASGSDAAAVARYPWETPGEGTADSALDSQAGSGLFLLERISDIVLQPPAAGRQPPAGQIRPGELQATRAAKAAADSELLRPASGRSAPPEDRP